jgi:hypothetical protein
LSDGLADRLEQGVDVGLRPEVDLDHKGREYRAIGATISVIISDMPITMRRTAEITVALPAAQAMALFTAEGERRWADGWDPSYPDARRREEAGTVFLTDHGHHRTTWIMVDHRPEQIRYARVTHGLTAGIVAVELIDAEPERTAVRVSYDLTALSQAGETWLEAFEAEYDQEIAAWATDIAAALAKSPSRPP